MSTLQKLDRSSPVVQRVLRLRERLARNDGDAEKKIAPPGKQAISSDTTQAEGSYQWQMWQKSDFSAYAGGAYVHRCK